MSASEIVQPANAAFGESDMETLASLMSDSYVGELPGSHPNGVTFNSPNDFIQNYLTNQNKASKELLKFLHKV